MTAEREASRLVEQTGYAILRLLRGQPDGASKGELARGCKVSEVTVQRALNWLREEQDAPIDWDRDTRQWKLLDRGFTSPLGDPSREDLTAVIFAGALLAPLGDDDLNQRVGRLIEEIDQRLDQRDQVRPGAIAASATATSPIDPKMLTTLVRAVGHSVVRIDYESPWRNDHRTHDVEPWQVRVHDGALYLRAFSRTSNSPRTFKVAQIDRVVVLDAFRPSAPVPAADMVWGTNDPAYGIDEDQPDVAVIRIRGPLARLMARVQWHPRQRDRWVEERELLERRVPYRSCREFARRLLWLGSSVESIEPEALRGAVRAHARVLLDNLGHADA